ncbi:hypothetical protein [uncultured Clostridium sp.]|uniref:hypothetical protein n=1 Tax=uncultured Clostridium sp. TaxID=59620 RepID=UPI0025D5A681|nr:hypothetical protein [uncultured Clostridium sp.]MDU4883217.1 hypothetical protein [Clostridium celatum]MDU7076947.1 hypothetical protein [Clostridium celatum]
MSVVEINKSIITIKKDVVKKEDQLSKLIDNFLECSDITKKVIDKKIKELEISIEEDNNKILGLERSKNSIDSNKLEIEDKIKRIKRELKVVDTVELTREELMDKIRYIKVCKDNKFVVEYN